jgi:hypothetical protein
LLTLGAIGTEIRDARIRARNVARQVFELLNETVTDNPTTRLGILWLYAALSFAVCRFLFGTWLCRPPPKKVYGYASFSPYFTKPADAVSDAVIAVLSFARGCRCGRGAFTRRGLPRRIAGFSCRRREVCFAGLASRRIRKSDACAGAAGGVWWRRHPRFSCRFLAAGERWDTRISAWQQRARMY